MNKMILSINSIKEEFLKEKQGIYEAISRDYRANEMDIEFEKLLHIFGKVANDGVVAKSESNVITVIYNGDPYVTLELALKSILSNNNLVLISENVMRNLNNQIIDIIKKFINDLKLQLVIKWYPDGDTGNISKLENLSSKIMFFGDKRNYRKIKNEIEIPIIYNGYGSITIYTDDADEFEEQIYEIKDYAIENNISINVYSDEINEDIEYINKDGVNHICIIFSNDISKIELFKKMVNSTYILVNDTKIEKCILEIPKEIWE